MTDAVITYVRLHGQAIEDSRAYSGKTIEEACREFAKDFVGVRSDAGLRVVAHREGSKTHWPLVVKRDPVTYSVHGMRGDCEKEAE